jgi:hypothetical protein
MYKKTTLYLLMVYCLLYSENIECMQDPLSVSVSYDETYNETVPYDHLDFLGDNLPEIEKKNVVVPHWIKSFFIAVILRLADLSDFWHKSWGKIKYTFKKQ